LQLILDALGGFSFHQITPQSNIQVITSSTSSLSAEQVTAVAAVFVAVAALVVSIWQGFVSRAHNRRSVTPHLRFDVGIIDKKPTLTLSNVGVGPAIVRGFECHLAGRPLAGSWYTQLRTVADALLTKGSHNHVYYPYRGDAVAVGEHIPIIFFEFDVYDEAVAQQVRDALCYSRFIVYYESIYDEGFVLDGPNEQRSGDE
jgi:hypothetical protein